MGLGRDPFSESYEGVVGALRVRKVLRTKHALDSSANILDATNVDPNSLFELLDNGSRPLPRRVYKFPETSGRAEFGGAQRRETIAHDVNLARLFT